MLGSNLAALGGILCIVVAVAELAGWPLGLLVLGVLLVAVAYALFTQASRHPAPPSQPEPGA